MWSFLKDIKRKELIPIKILMFLIYGGQATLYPYFTVHLKSLNVSIQETAVLFAVQPIIALIVAPMIGMAADKIGNFKLIFSFFLTFSAITTNLLLLVPPAPMSHELLRLNCDSSSFLSLLQKDSCIIDRNLNNTYLNATLTFSCHKDCNETVSNDPFFLLNKEDSCSKDCDGVGCVELRNSSLIDTFIYISLSKSENASISLDTLSKYLIVYENDTYNHLVCPCSSSKCKTQCSFYSKDPLPGCLGISKQEESFGTTFWSYLGIRLVVTLGIGLVNGLFDAASMTIIQNLKADVGYQRFWSTIGMCLLAPISGYFVDKFATFRPCFFMYGGLYLTAALTSLKLDLSMKLPSENPMKNLKKLIRNPEVVILLFQIALLGICWGFLENFLFWFLESELGSNNLVMGLTVTVGSGTGLFMALGATWCTRKLGYVNVIIIAFAAYTVRFLGYALAQNAYVCLIFEMMENFTVTLLTVGVTLYCTELASMDMLTTIMTMWNGLHVISGRAFGSLLGGFLVQNFGFRQTFKFFAYGSACFGAFYALMYITWLRRWQRNHRRESIRCEKSSSFISEEEEDEKMKSQAFSSSLLHCSLDSPAINYYTPEQGLQEPRRRALSHTPAQVQSSLAVGGLTPRYAVSFNESSLQRSFPVVKKNANVEREQNGMEGELTKPVDVREDIVTKF